MGRVVILHYAGPPVVGGVESTIDHHARLLVGAGYEVDVIAGRGADFHPRVRFHLVEEVDSRHPDILEAGASLAKGEVTAEVTLLRDRLIARLAPLLEGSDCCIVHNALTLHKNLPLTAALKALHDRRITPLIAWSHDFAWHDPLYTSSLHPGQPWNLLRTAWPGVTYVTVSEHRRDRLAELFGIPPAEIRVIYPGVEPAAFLSLPPFTRDLANQLDLEKADPLVLLPSRITRRKNIEFALQVMAALKEIHPRAVLLITGPPGPHNPKNQAYLDSLSDLRRQLDLMGSVHFLYEMGEGDAALHLPDEEVAGLYRLADLLLFPSRREGFGIPVLEAGLARIPVFAADIPSVRESAANLAQVFDPEGDPREVAQEIVDYLSEDRAYQLRRRVLDCFTWSAILENQLRPLIEEVKGA